VAHMPNLSLKTKLALFNGSKVSDNRTGNSVNLELDYLGAMPMHSPSTKLAHCVECCHSVVIQMKNYWSACNTCLPINDSLCIKHKALDPRTKGIQNTSFYIMKCNFVQDVDFLYSISYYLLCFHANSSKIIKKYINFGLSSPPCTD
jgi:hypothetical protein